MQFVLQTPSLRHLAGVNIAAHLWTRRHIFTQIAQSCNQLHVRVLQPNSNEWTAIEKKVESNVMAISLPETCKNELLKLIKPLGMEINYWCKYHCEKKDSFQFLENLSPQQQICWTMHGTIDYAKTAQSIVKDERLDMKRRYEIACLNCLKNEAGELFESMGKKRRREIVSKMISIGHIDHRYLIAFFTYTLSVSAGEPPNNLKKMMVQSQSSYNNWLFERTLRSGSSNRARVKYLFEQLNQREKEQLLEECKWYPIGSVLYLLSLMNAEQHRKSGLLLCLLRWPMQPLFMAVAKRKWRSMDWNACGEVLKGIVDKILFGFGDYDYCQLFWECWRLSPPDDQQYILLCWPHRRLLGDLLLTKRQEFIQLVLNEAPSQQIQNCFDEISDALMDESVICDAALLECKQTALLNSSNDEEEDEEDDKEKRLRSACVSRLVDMVMEERIKRRL